MATSTMTPSPRIAHGHGHTSQRQQRPTLATRTPSARSPTIRTSRATLSPSAAKSTAREARHQSPSYFGLAFDTNHQPDGNDSNEGTHARNNWSPPTSKVRSIAAASPRAVPLDQNPEFEAFRWQAELNQGNVANSFGGGAPFGSLSGFSVRAARVDSHQSASAMKSVPSGGQKTEETGDGLNPSGDDQHCGAQRRSPKRVLSSPSFDITERPRRNSPAGFDNRDEAASSQPAKFLDRAHHDRSAPPQSTTRPPMTQRHSSITRAQTLPNNASFDASANDGPMFVSAEHVVSLLEASSEDLLLLDLRVSTQHAAATIADALNLCIPTTLLKRPSFNVQKLAETFKDPKQRARFEGWQRSRYIVVFDQATSHSKDAAICINTLKKFGSEGWTGGSYIIRGGFLEFSAKFPGLVRKGGAATGSKSRPTLSLSTDRPEVAPVVGGCPMPATKNAANPFFGNIRQNMDLIGGVGQMAVTQPTALSAQKEQKLPQWLKQAADPSDNGKLVSEKFLGIERREQKRMQEALSGNVIYTSGTPSKTTAPMTPSGVRKAPNGKVQIAGIEKGSKNRYNNIWPYEHSRVKLQDVDEGCDYVNANYIKTRWSSKRYIATQGPIPATFGDFWNVIWQQDIRVIVMLTAESEGGQLKAHNYWKGGEFDGLKLTYLSEHRATLEPGRIHAHGRLNSQSSVKLPQSSSSSSSGPKTAHSNSSAKQLHRPSPSPRRASSNTASSVATSKDAALTNDQPYVIVRRFTLSRADQPFARMREITQLQYSNWPDFGAPAHPAHLLGLVEQCNRVVRQSKGSEGGSNEERPVLVHCSAGCGRTGTFCTVDSVVDLLQKQKAWRAKHDSGAAEKQQNSQRELSPMDVDATREKQGEDAGRMSVEMSAAPPTGFFASALTMTSPVSPAGKGLGTDVDAGEDGWLARDDIDLVEKVVEEFRLQRLSMVQSLRQFVLCYESVLEWLNGADE